MIVDLFFSLPLIKRSDWVFSKSLNSLLPIGWKDLTQTICATDSFERSDSNELCNGFIWKIRLKRVVQRIHLKDPTQTSCATVSFERSDSNDLCNWFIWKIRLKRVVQRIHLKDPTQTSCATDSFERSDSNELCNCFVWKIRLKRFVQLIHLKDPTQTSCATDSFERSDSNELCNGFIWKIRLKRVVQLIRLKDPTQAESESLYFALPHCYENTRLVLSDSWYVERSLTSVQFSFSNLSLLEHECYCGTHLVVLVAEALCDEAAEVGWVCGDQLQISPPLSAEETTRV